jgi:hypothetical protein
MLVFVMLFCPLFWVSAALLSWLFRGACEPTFRHNVTDRARGDYSTAGGATAQGRVLRTGAVRVLVQSGSEWADSYGHLRGNRGAGVWRGQGSRGRLTALGRHNDADTLITQVNEVPLDPTEY